MTLSNFVRCADLSLSILKEARFVERLRAADLQLVRMATRTATPQLINHLAVTFTRLGNGWIYPILCAVILLRWGSFGIRIIASALITAALLHSVYPGLKRRLPRERPFVVDFEPAQSLRAVGHPLVSQRPHDDDDRRGRAAGRLLAGFVVGVHFHGLRTGVVAAGDRTSFSQRCAGRRAVGNCRRIPGGHVYCLALVRSGISVARPRESVDPSAKSSLAAYRGEQS